MQCPKCGTQNPDTAKLCRSCSWVLAATAINAPSPDAKTSRLAIAALVLAILSFCTFLLTAIPAVIVGIIGLVKIEKSAGRLKGRGLAIAGIALPVASLPIVAMLIGILMPALARTRQLAYRVVCSSNMQALGKAMFVYAADHNDEYPTASKWCDLLQPYCQSNKNAFVCPAADKGRCHYAISPDATLSSPPDMVLLFETCPGWNQSGGPEILSTRNHAGDGCNILYVDGHVEFVRTKDINNLKWTPDLKQ